MDALNASVALDNDSVTIVAARLDSFSMFDGQYPGVDSATLGFVAVHAVAEALGKVRDKLSVAAGAKPVLFALFHGEAFDYIGSSRAVYDIINTHDLSPLTLDSIDSFIEIGQVGLHHDTASDEPLYIHTDPLSRKNEDTCRRLDDLSEKLKSAGLQVGLNVTEAPKGNPLPPASMQSFLKARPNMTGVLLSTHSEQFKNKYYNSIFDRPSEFGLNDTTSNLTTYNHVTPAAEFLHRISTTVARVVYQLATGREPVGDSVEASNLTITRLLYCFTVDSDCEILNETSSFGLASAIKNKKNYLSRYVGVAQRSSVSLTYPTIHHYNLLAYHTGERQPDNTTQKECVKLSDEDKLHKYVYLEGPLNTMDNSSRMPICVRAAVNFSEAMSPVFIPGNPDKQWTWDKYSTWTESSWATNAMQVRIFLVPSPAQELTTLVVGLAILVVSMTIGYLVNRSGVSVTSQAFVLSRDDDY
jgi:nicastrin